MIWLYIPIRGMSIIAFQEKVVKYANFIIYIMRTK